MTTTGPVRVTFSASDPSPSSGMKQIPDNLSFNQDTKYIKTFTAFDNAGNESNSVEVKVYIDRTPPDIPDPVTLTSTNNADLSKAEVETKLGALIKDKPSDIASGVASVSYSGIPAGGLRYIARNTWYTVTITATDNAGNRITKEIKVRLRDK